MTFFLKKEEVLRTKPTTRVVVFVLIAAVVISVGYITALAILAPQQLAEATAAATDLVCSGCVGTTDIADSAVTSAKIGSGQVGNSDIANDAVGSAKIAAGQVGNSDLASNAVTSAKIAAGQVANSDIATSAVTTGKISDTNGVRSVDIVNNEVTAVDIGVGQVQPGHIADNAIQPNVQRLQEQETIEQGTSEDVFVVCPTGTIVTGGGYATGGGVLVSQSHPVDQVTWGVLASNPGNEDHALHGFALCIGPMP
jgi:hypothetical protein